jgi:hypothetical protein
MDSSRQGRGLAREGQLSPSPGCRPDQVPRLVLVALGAARQVYDGPDPGHRGLGTLARGQITGHELHTVPGRMAVPAERPDVAAGVPQARDDVPPERARSAGDQG